MFYKHHYKKEKEKEKEIFQKMKDMDKYDLILIIIPVFLMILLGLLIFLNFKTDKKTVDIKIQNQVVTQQNINS